MFYVHDISLRKRTKNHTWLYSPVSVCNKLHVCTKKTKRIHVKMFVVVISEW